MIKINTILSILTISLILCTAAAYAEETNSQTSLQDLQEKKDQAENIKNKIEQDKTAFLLHSWEEFLSKTSLGRIIIQVGSFLEYISPVFVVFVGMPYELSWLFFLSVIVVIWVGMIIYRAVKVFASHNAVIAFILTLAVLGLIVRGRIIQNSLLFFSPLFSNGIVTLLTVVVGTACILAYNIIMKKIGKKLDEKRKIEQEKEREIKDKKLDVIKDIKIVSGKV